jgi:hypothetical protein
MELSVVLVKVRECLVVVEGIRILVAVLAVALVKD